VKAKQLWPHGKSVLKMKKPSLDYLFGCRAGFTALRGAERIVW